MRALAHQREQVQLGLDHAAGDADHRDAPSGRERLKVLRHVGSPDELEDHVERAMLAEALAGSITSAPSAATCATQLLVAHGRRHASAACARELDRRGADPAGATVHEQALTGAQPRLREDRVVRGHEHLRQAARGRL